MLYGFSPRTQDSEKISLHAAWFTTDGRGQQKKKTFPFQTVLRYSSLLELEKCEYSGFCKPRLLLFDEEMKIARKPEKIYKENPVG